MRTLFRVLAVVALLTGAARALSPFAGTWHRTANGLPAVTLTVQDQDGKLSGTVVFYLQVRDAEDRPWHVDGGDIVEILDAKVEGTRLQFEVRHHTYHGSSEYGPNVKMTVELAGTDVLKLGDIQLKRLK